MATPPNTQTSAALAAEAKRTPIGPKLANREQGNTAWRTSTDQIMVQEVRFVEISVDEFKKLLPEPSKPFDPTKHSTTIDLKSLKVKSTDHKNESETYPALVCGLSLLLCLLF